MPTREERLRDFTHKDDGLTVARRIESTLTEDESRTAARTAKAFSVLGERLHRLGVITDEALDEILLTSVEGVYRREGENG